MSDKLSEHSIPPGTQEDPKHSIMGHYDELQREEGIVSTLRLCLEKGISHCLPHQALNCELCHQTLTRLKHFLTQFPPLGTRDPIPQSPPQDVGKRVNIDKTSKDSIGHIY